MQCASGLQGAPWSFSGFLGGPEGLGAPKRKKMHVCLLVGDLLCQILSGLCLFLLFFLSTRVPLLPVLPVGGRQLPEQREQLPEQPEQLP